MTENAANAAIAAIIAGDTTPATAVKAAPTVMTFDTLTKKWEAAKGPGLEVPTFNLYRNTLRSAVLPTFKNMDITKMAHDEIQLFLNGQAKSYSVSSLRSMRVALGHVLKYARTNHWIADNPCVDLVIPKVANTERCIKRTAHSEEEIMALVGLLKEPYATLVWLQFSNGLRIEEAVAIQLRDFSGCVLRIQRYIYDGVVYELKAEEQRDAPIMDADLLERIRTLGQGHEWVFRSNVGTPFSLRSNGLKRYLNPAAKKLKLDWNGWHDLRHSFTTLLRRKGVHPKVISALLGHKRVELAMNVYDHCDLNDLEKALTGKKQKRGKKPVKKPNGKVAINPMGRDLMANAINRLPVQ
jgi:integrase